MSGRKTPVPVSARLNGVKLNSPRFSASCDYSAVDVAEEIQGQMQLFPFRPADAADSGADPADFFPDSGRQVHGDK